ncbi:MAG: permease, partial [Candidatus Acetothermia bacterium]|nr:permease [Candidatus Acetothermia bacterium]
MKVRLRQFLILLGVFLAAYFLPVGSGRVQGALVEAFAMLHEYAREHVLLCLVPALFIAGAIAVFVSQASVMKYFGPTANKFLSYSVASVSGTILAVCSCTVLPLFAGIYTRGAGIGPATAFLYSGPAINVLAIAMTARVLGFELGLARAVGAIAFAFLVGVGMHLFFLREERQKARDAEGFSLPPGAEARPLWQTAAYFAAMVGILVF